MTAQETFVSNGAESTLSSSLPSSDTTINVTDTSSFPSVPFYAVIEPDVDAKREVILVDSSKTATTFVLTDSSKRGLDGTTATSHDSGSKVVCVPVAALWTDINDRVDGKSDTSHTHTESDISDLGTYYEVGGTDVAVTDGGTGASTAADARTNLAVVGTAGDTMSGELNLADNLLTRPIIKDYAEETATDATSGAAKTIDLTTGNVHDITLTANCTFTFSNPPASGDAGSFTLILRQDGTGSRTATWPASVDWPGGTAPTLTTTASGVDVLTFLTVDGGTTWLGFVSGQAFS